MYFALQNLPELRIGADVLPFEPPIKHPLLSSWKNHDAWLDITTINQNTHYQRNRMNQNRDISQNPIFWPILALKWVKYIAT